MHLVKFTGVLTERYWPSVPCPSCEVGNLRLEEGVKVVWASSVEVAPEYPPLAEVDHFGRFTALRCDNESCREGAVVAGSAYVDEQWEHPAESRYQTFLRVRFVEPALRILQFPQRTPDSVERLPGPRPRSCGQAPAPRPTG